MKVSAEKWGTGVTALYEEEGDSLYHHGNRTEYADNPSYRELQKMIMEDHLRYDEETKNREDADPDRLAGFAKSEGIAFGNEILFGAKRMGKFS